MALMESGYPGSSSTLLPSTMGREPRVLFSSAAEATHSGPL